MADKFKPVIDTIIKLEGGSKATDTSGDKGGRTQYGLSETSNPKAWLDGKVTEDEARDIYMRKYVDGPKFSLIGDSHEAVRTQLIDFGVLSGPALAIMKLQAILGTEQDGKLGPETLALLSKADPLKVNNLLVGERIKMIGRIVSKKPDQAKFLNGWLDRVVSFIR